MTNKRFETADRLRQLPPYLFIEIDKLKKKALSDGADLIDLGIGDPDLPTLAPIVEELAQACRDPKNHPYPLGRGLVSFRIAVANWYKQRFGIILDPETEVLILIGSKEGIGHIPLAFVNPGDKVLIPDPGYPVYRASTIFAGGIPEIMPLRPENDWLPDFDSIQPDVLEKAKLMFLNYPNNPTSAIAGPEFFKKAVEAAQKNNFIICHDAAYSEIYFDSEKPSSFLQTEGARETGIEFHSLSKTFNMTGWRVGFAVGNREALSGLADIKSNLDSGQFHALQVAGIKALGLPESYTDDLRSIYKERRDILVNGLKNIGWEANNPHATFYVWCKVPHHYSSTEFASLLLTKTDIVATPGVGFGKYGEGYIRFSITSKKERLVEAVNRLAKLVL